jgi:hypothetical protein
MNQRHIIKRTQIGWVCCTFGRVCCIFGLHRFVLSKAAVLPIYGWRLAGFERPRMLMAARNS